MSTVDIKQGDCLELMKQVPDKSIDMILCDLPYGTTRNKWDSIIPFEPLWENYNRIIKDNGRIVLFSSQPFTSQLVMSNPTMFRYEWIWQKDNVTGFLNSKKMPLKCHENICVFYKKLPVYNPQMRTGFTPYTCIRGHDSSNYGKQTYTKTVNDGTRYPIDLLQINVQRGLHPTQKPVPLCEYLIKTYSNIGGTVLDNCMGSGSTGVARVNTNRNFIGYELNTDYFKTAEERIYRRLNNYTVLQNNSEKENNF